MAGPDLLERIDRAIAELQAIRDELVASMRRQPTKVAYISTIWRPST